MQVDDVILANLIVCNSWLNNLKNFDVFCL